MIIYLKVYEICSKMSQSDVHRELVIQVSQALKSRYPQISVTTDVQQIPGDEVPPMIGRHRPDIYAKEKSSYSLVIGEAKTDGDLNNEHTYNQIMSFINYLEQKKCGSFVLAVTGYRANRAKVLLGFICRQVHAENTDILVFDSCDFWMLDQNGGMTWHLS